MINVRGILLIDIKELLLINVRNLRDKRRKFEKIST